MTYCASCGHAFHWQNVCGHGAESTAGLCRCTNPFVVMQAAQPTVAEAKLARYEAALRDVIVMAENVHRKDPEVAAIARRAREALEKT